MTINDIWRGVRIGVKVGIRSVVSNFGTLTNPGWWSSLISGKSNSGVNVTANTALNLSAVFACVRRSSETLSTLPVHVFRKTETGRQEVESPVTHLLGRSPNPWMPANVFREVIQGHLELRGKAFAEIVRDGRGIPVELWPIHPDNIKIDVSISGRLVYTYIPTGYPFQAEKILHFRGLGSNGIDSYSPVALAKESIGLGLAAQEYGARFFGQGTNMGGFIQHKGTLSDEAWDRLRTDLNQKYLGLEKTHGLIILEEGMEYQKIGLSNDDAQFLETRKFQVSEIARWFGMPPHMIGDLEKATFSNIEQQSIEAVQYTWRPRVVRLEQEINMKLLPPGEYVRFSLEGLLRGDIKSRYEAYKIGVINGWLSADEVRSLEDMNPQPDGMGQIFLAPTNMTNKAKYLPEAEDPEGSDPAGANAAAAAVDDTGAGVTLNGAQVQAATAIVMAVAAGELPRNAGIGQLKILFNLSQSQAEELMGSAGDGSKLTPNKAPETNPARSGKIREIRVDRKKMERRSIADRRYVADKYRSELRAATEKVIKEELRWLNEELKGKTADEAREYIIAEFGSLETFVTDTFTPIYKRASEELFPIFAEEVGSDEKIDDEFRKQLDEYVVSFAKRYLSQDRGSLVNVIKDAIDSEADYTEAVTARASAWKDTRPQQIEQLETTRLRNYFALAAYASMGIKKIRSVSNGKSCPYCNAIDGVVVDVYEPFIRKGEEFKPEGAELPLTPTSNRSHPPYHDGCDCDIVSEG